MHALAHIRFCEGLEDCAIQGKSADPVTELCV